MKKMSKEKQLISNGGLTITMWGLRCGGCGGCFVGYSKRMAEAAHGNHLFIKPFDKICFGKGRSGFFPIPVTK